MQSQLYTGSMRARDLALSAAVAGMAFALVTLCGYMGLLSAHSAETGTTRGALLGAVVAAAILSVHGVRILFARTPEARGPQFNRNSVEQHRFREAAAQAFADLLIVLAVLVVATFSLLSELEAFGFASLVFLIAVGDFGVRSLSLKHRGV